MHQTIQGFHHRTVQRLDKKRPIESQDGTYICVCHPRSQAVREAEVRLAVPMHAPRMRRTYICRCHPRSQAVREAEVRLAVRAEVEGAVNAAASEIKADRIVRP